MAESDAPQPMVFLLFGSRTVAPSIETITHVLFERFAIGPDMVQMVIHGDARDGADASAKAWAAFYDLKVMAIQPDYKRYGSYYAPKMRNREMAIELGKHAPHCAGLGFWDAFSGGTCDMVARLVMRNMRVELVPLDPRRHPVARNWPPANWGTEEWMQESGGKGKKRSKEGQRS